MADRSVSQSREHIVLACAFLPNEDGTPENFSVVESSNMDPALSSKYPDIKSYMGKGIDNPTEKIYFSGLSCVSADVPCGNTGDRASISLIGTPSPQIAYTEINGPEEVAAGSTNNYVLLFYEQPPAGISYSWTADGGSVVGGWGSYSVNIKAGSIGGYVRVMGTNS